MNFCSTTEDENPHVFDELPERSRSGTPHVLTLRQTSDATFAGASGFCHVEALPECNSSIVSLESCYQMQTDCGRIPLQCQQSRIGLGIIFQSR